MYEEIEEYFDDLKIEVYSINQISPACYMVETEKGNYIVNLAVRKAK